METVKLPSGIYTSEETKDLLMSTIDANINFYNIKNLSAHIHSGFPDSEIQQKIDCLKIAKEKLQSMLDQVADSNERLRIESVIHISFENEKVELSEEECMQAESY